MLLFLDNKNECFRYKLQIKPCQSNWIQKIQSFHIQTHSILKRHYVWRITESDADMSLSDWLSEWGWPSGGQDKGCRVFHLSPRAFQFDHKTTVPFQPRNLINFTLYYSLWLIQFFCWKCMIMTKHPFWPNLTPFDPQNIHLMVLQLKNSVSNWWLV